MRHELAAFPAVPSDFPSSLCDWWQVIFHASCFSPAVFFQRRCVCIHLRLKGSRAMNCDRLYRSLWDRSIIMATACACCGASGERWTGPHAAGSEARQSAGKQSPAALMGWDTWRNRGLANVSTVRTDGKDLQLWNLRLQTVQPARLSVRQELPWHGTRLLPLLISMFSHTSRNPRNIKSDVWICRDLRAPR